MSDKGGEEEGAVNVPPPSDILNVIEMQHTVLLAAVASGFTREEAMKIVLVAIAGLFNTKVVFL